MRCSLHVDGAPYDFSFSGLKTAVINLLHNARQKGETVDIDSLAASFQRTVCEVLTDKLCAAARAYGCTTIAAAGGVSANSGLRAALEQMCRAQGWQYFAPPLSLCGDNAAMIGAQAYYEYQAGVRAGADLNAAPSMDIAEGFAQARAQRAFGVPSRPAGSAV